MVLTVSGRFPQTALPNPLGQSVQTTSGPLAPRGHPSLRKQTHTQTFPAVPQALDTAGPERATSFCEQPAYTCSFPQHGEQGALLFLIFLPPPSDSICWGSTSLSISFPRNRNRNRGRHQGPRHQEQTTGTLSLSHVRLIQRRRRPSPFGGPGDTWCFPSLGTTSNAW